MSAREIIAELPKLTRPELEELDTHLHKLLCCNLLPSTKSWGEDGERRADTLKS